MTLWKESNDEVWCIGERQDASLQGTAFVISAVTFSLALDLRRKSNIVQLQLLQHTTEIIYMYTYGF